MTTTLPLSSMFGMVVLIACGPTAEIDGGAPDGGTGDAGAVGAVARFAPSDGMTAMMFGDVPFPHDLYLDDDGHVSLASLPLETATSPGLTALLERTRAETGFCVICGTHFFIDGSLDATSVPSSLSASATAAVVLADVDPSSPERGRLFPIELQWLASAGRLSVRLPLGITLHRDRTYAVAITSQLRGEDGAPLAATDVFIAARDGTGSTDAAIVRARTVLEPALAELASAGVDVGQIVSCAVFTTHDPVAPGLALRETVHGAPAPTGSVDRVYPSATTTLDALMGVPATPDFGLDVPEAGGVAGERGILHASTSRIIVGSIAGVRVIEGSGTDVGTLPHDASGAPIRTGTEEIPFVLVIPTGADVTSLPVAIVAHGHPRTMEDALVLADTLGTEGIAVLGYDAFQHGGRSLGAVDALTVRGAAGADGFFEHDRSVVQAQIFAGSGVPDGFSAATVYREGTFAQILADALLMVRFAVEGDLSAIAAADPALAGLAFDPDAVFVVGNSFGTFAASALLSIEPDLDAAVLNVPGGSNFQDLFGSAIGRVAVDLLLPLAGIRGRLDETTRRSAFEPMLDIAFWILSPYDAAALAPYAYLDPAIDGPRPDVLLQIAELDEFLPTWGAQSVVASLGAERIGPFGFVDGVPMATLPVSGNVTTSAGPVTAVAHLYEGASHLMLATAVSAVGFESPIAPPFQQLDTPLAIANPTQAVHEEIRAFLSTRVATGRARIE